ncbi:membrane-bound lytic murein transglycosylase D [Mariprofundus micogutta]|uniref:Membrane-bound lytic murein transglycosylase D n=1 Tax=Mariprofundus micogutta TaxID=1921010 RepID=A0A1L8CNP7_9PROT|nr:lytic transglycosylase domain-containing protein [Mariprofundus micogutta]GAV20552.1 membrane-bound lytic murein transglycosylase D [Mariprofundus micogutta]
MLNTFSPTSLFRTLLIVASMSLISCAQFQQPEVSAEKPVKPETVQVIKPSNPFLAGLTDREIQNIKNEAWRVYGRHWKPVAARSRYVRQPLIETLDRFGYPRELQMVPVVESSYDPYAHSTVGAAGLWQLMPVTASDLNIKHSKYIDGRREIRTSTRAAAKYLTRQYRRFGNWEMALAAYHLGPSAVQRRLNRRPWKPEDGLRKMPLPPITKTYIRHIIGLIALHHDGLIKFPKPYRTETIKVQTPIDINALQTRAELPENQIFRFNPQLKLNQYVDGKPKALKLRISKTRVKKVKQSIASIERSHMTITIAKGDDLSDISSRYNTSTHLIRANNPGLQTPLATGQKLRLPVKLLKRADAEENPMLKDVSKQKMVADNSGTRI